MSAIRTKRITLDRGTSVRVIESGLPRGDAILLVHGWGGCVYSFAEMIPVLADAGYRVIALDLPGLGLSDIPDDPSAFTLPAMASAVMDVARALRIERFALVGHSMGGAIGLRLALDGERAMTRLILINSAGLGRAPLIAPLRLLSPGLVDRFTPALLGRGTIRLILEIAFATRGRPRARDVDEYWAPTQFDSYARACREFAHHFSFEPVSDKELRSLHLPVLSIGSGRDRLVHGCSERAELIRNARIVTVPRGGHLVLQECDDIVNPAVLEFLKETGR